MIPDSFIEELKYRVDIEQLLSSYINLKRRGNNLIGLCPFHSEKTPSFTVYREDQHYYCFGCGAGGDIITFIRQMENLEYVEAVKFLAERVGITVPEDAQTDRTAHLKNRILEMNREAARFYHMQLKSDAGKSARTYLLDRGLAWRTITKFGLGYAPESWNALRDHLKEKGFNWEEMQSAALVNKGRQGSFYDSFRDRVIFPIIDLRGNVIGFGGRIMKGDGPKYLNSSDTPVFKKNRNLYALGLAKSTGSDTLILGEGYMDVIAMHQAGFENAVATLGTSLTVEQARLIAGYAKKVVIAYDSDNAGQNAAKRAINLFAQDDVSVSVLSMEGAKDPDEYIGKFGAARFQNLIESGKSAVKFEIDKLRAGYNLQDPEEQLGFLNAFCRLMADVQSDLQREVYIGEMARELDVDKKRLVSTVDGIQKQRYYAKKKRGSHNLAMYAQDNPSPERKRASSDGLTSLIAEENLIVMLMRHPDYYAEIRGKIDTGDFRQAELSKVFSAIEQRLEGNLPIELIHLSAELNPAQMGRLSQLLYKGRGLQFYKEQADDYIGAIKRSKEVKTDRDIAGMNTEEYERYIASLRANKK